MPTQKKTSSFRPLLESLENRLLPSLNVLSVGGQASFTDADGDIITVRISASPGGVGTIDFDDDNITGNGNGVVEDGEQIAQATITGASASFSVAFSVDSSTNALADGNVVLGAISSNRIIRAIYTVPDVSALNSDFDLLSFSGPGFSKGGGLWVDDIVGDANGTALQIESGLAAGSVISVRDTIEAGNVNIGTLATHHCAGAVNVGPGGVAGGTWTISGGVARTGVLSLSGTPSDPTDTVDTNDFLADLTVNGAFNGLFNVDDDVLGSVDILGGVGTAAGFLCERLVDLFVQGHFAGKINIADDLTLDVRGNLTPAAFINADYDIDLRVGGNVAVGARVNADEALDVDIEGTFSGNFTASTDITGNIRDVRGGSMDAGSGITLDIGGSISFHPITCDLPRFTAGTAIDIDVDGSVTGASFTSHASSVFLDIEGSLLHSTVQANTNLTANVDRNVVHSSLTSSAGDVVLDIGGNVTSSHLSAVDGLGDIVGSIDGSLVNSHLVSQHEVDIDDLNSVSGSIFGSDVTLDVSGTVSGDIHAEEDMVVSFGRLTGSVSAEQLDFLAGDVGVQATIQANNVLDLNSDGDGFFVANAFRGRLNAMSIFTPTNVQLVGGIVGAAAQMNITGLFGNPGDSFSFGDDFRGQLNISGPLDVDLDFAGDVNIVTIGGPIGPTGTDRTITVGGFLTFLSTSNLFFEILPGLTGEFRDGLGSTTGFLVTLGGFGEVVPQV